MSSVQDFIYGLRDKNSEYAYHCLNELELLSKNSNEVYPYLDSFIEMLDDSNSYIRIRGILLIIFNAKWDVKCKIDEIIDQLLKCIMDEKPIIARQCIQALPSLVKDKPILKKTIINALQMANPLKYKETMQKLILDDIQKSLELIDNIEITP